MRCPSRAASNGEDDGPNVPGGPEKSSTATTSGCHAMA